MSNEERVEEARKNFADFILNLTIKIRANLSEKALYEIEDFVMEHKRGKYSHNFWFLGRSITHEGYYDDIKIISSKEIEDLNLILWWLFLIVRSKMINLKEELGLLNKERRNLKMLQEIIYGLKLEFEASEELREAIDLRKKPLLRKLVRDELIKLERWKEDFMILFRSMEFWVRKDLDEVKLREVFRQKYKGKEKYDVIWDVIWNGELKQRVYREMIFGDRIESLMNAEKKFELDVLHWGEGKGLDSFVDFPIGEKRGIELKLLGVVGKGKGVRDYLWELGMVK